MVPPYIPADSSGSGESGWSYGGYTWVCLADACRDLGLDYDDVIAWIDENRAALSLASGSILALYINQHRFITDGLIFSTLEAVALHHGVPTPLLRTYLDRGFGIDLAAHMIRRGIPPTYFRLDKDSEDDD